EELYDQGITGGYPDGTYRPENQVSRAEMAVFLVSTFNLP
ncbi:S-layer homology domain-containing protein, partial [bacterium]|nr:S-layer homology domain-containing protein [bacterium]